MNANTGADTGKPLSSIDTALRLNVRNFLFEKYHQSCQAVTRILEERFACKPLNIIDELREHVYSDSKTAVIYFSIDVPAADYFSSLCIPIAKNLPPTLHDDAVEVRFDYFPIDNACTPKKSVSSLEMVSLDRNISRVHYFVNRPKTLASSSKLFLETTLDPGHLGGQFIISEELFLFGKCYQPSEQFLDYNSRVIASHKSQRLINRHLSYVNTV